MNCYSNVTNIVENIIQVNAWNGQTRLEIAVLIDVDGTLASAYRNGRRELRPSSLEFIKLLSSNASVFLWSIAGKRNAERLIEEFSQLQPFIQGCWGKDEFPFEMVNYPYCIDDTDLDEAVRRCNHIILGQTWDGGDDPGDLAKAARIVVESLKTH